MLDIQLGRRNLSPIQRIAVAEKYRPIYEKQALINKQVAMQEARKNNDKNKSEQFSQNSSTTVNDNKVDVRSKLAKTAGVSTDTYSKGKKILDSDNEELKQEVLSGEKSINAGYEELTQGKNEERLAMRNKYSCELKVCSTKKPWNPTAPPALPAVPELSALCVIRAPALKGGKNVSENNA